jgi:hypothetical protein
MKMLTSSAYFPEAASTHKDLWKPFETLQEICEKLQTYWLSETL